MDTEQVDCRERLSNTNTFEWESGEEEVKVEVASVWAIGHVGVEEGGGDGYKVVKSRGKKPTTTSTTSPTVPPVPVPVGVRVRAPRARHSCSSFGCECKPEDKPKTEAESTIMRVIIDDDGEFKAICGVGEKRPEYESMGTGEITIDSAAEESVWPVGAADGFPIEDLGAKKPMKFIAANGAQMKHYGGKKVTFQAGSTGKIAGLNFQVTDVLKPLAAVWRLAEKNHLVQFGPDPADCFIKHKVTGDKIFMKQKRGSYVLEVEFVKKISEVTAASTFRRRA